MTLLGNYRSPNGVYCGMMRSAVCLLLVYAGFAQVRPEDPLQAQLNAVYKSREAGKFTEAAALREDARRILEKAPADTPQFAGMAHAVARLYEAGARTVQARAVLGNALDRVPAQSPGRMELLSAIADSWSQDRNLKRAVEYLERAAAAQEAAPAPAPTAQPSRQTGFSGLVQMGIHAQRIRFSSHTAADSNLENFYRRLAWLEQQLGHPDAVAVWHGKLRTLAARQGENELASILEQQGQLGEAAAIRKHAAERATSAEDALAEFSSLAQLYQRQGRMDDAIGAQQQVIAGAPVPAIDERTALARLLQQAGRTPQADAAFSDLLDQGSQDEQVRTLQYYANHLASTQRGIQAIAALTAFRDSHSALPPDQEIAIYFALAQASRSAGDEAKAADYQARGAAANKRQEAQVPAPPRFDSLLREAQQAATEGKIADAYSKGMEVLSLAPGASNRDQIGWLIPSIAAAMTQHKASALGELLFQRAVALAESWSDETLQPLLNLLGNRVHLLIAQPDLRSQEPAMLERYRSLLIEAHGADSGVLDEPMRIAAQFERTRNAPPASLLPAQDLLAYVESVNGNTSEPYLQALRTLAETYDYNADHIHVIPVRKQMVQIADLVCGTDDAQRGQVRAELALALANNGDFDEAERVALEATHHPYALQQVRQMRAARAR